MGHDHSHGHSHEHSQGHSHALEANARNRRALTAVLVLTAFFMVAEVVGGLLTGSLALLADAGHMLSDVAALGLALFAFWLSGRPATPERSFGYKRAEVLAALANGLTLVAVSVWIFFEAYRRFFNPPEVLGTPMLVVAAIGLVVNVVGALILARSSGENLNTRGAMRHVIADALGSAGVIVAAGIIILTGWSYADPIMSVLIGVLVLGSSYGLLRDSLNVLLEASPQGIDANTVGKRMASIPGVVEVHDLHIWTITSGFPALAAHVLVGTDEDCHARRRDLEHLLSRDFDITHTTLQMDHVGDHAANLHALQFRSKD
jgi:cobalt-zinc-cadmium efflux system protein